MADFGPIEIQPANQFDASTEESDVLTEARDRFRRCCDAEKVNRDRAMEDVKFLDGEDQWSPEAKTARKDRPMLTINKLPSHVDQVIGAQRQNRNSISVSPTDASSAGGKDIESIGRNRYKMSQVYEGLIRDIERQSNADSAYDHAGQHSAEHGFGYFRIITNYVDDDVFDQVIRIKRIRNAFTVYLDPDAMEQDKRDANFGFVTRWVDKDEFANRYPGADPISDFAADRDAGVQWEGWWKDSNVLVAEYFRRVPIKKTVGLFSNGAVYTLNDETKKVVEELQASGVDLVKSREVEGSKVEWFLLAGAQVIRGPVEFPCKFIPIIEVSGKELNVDGVVIKRGVIRHAKDAQRSYNYARSAHVEGIALQPKAPYIAAIDQIAEHEKAWNEANISNAAFLPYTPVEGLGAPQRATPPLPSPGWAQEMQVADSDINATTGFFPPSLGADARETSGKAIRARQSTADTSSFVFIDNIGKAIRYAGEILVDMIPRVYDSERVVRIRFSDDTEDFVRVNQTVTDEQTGERVMLHDLSAGRFDVLVSTGPSHATQRAEAVDSMIDYLGVDPAAAPMIRDLLMQSMDWPLADKVAERLRKMLPPELQEGDAGEEPQEPKPPSQEEKIAQVEGEAKLATAEAKVAAAETKELEALVSLFDKAQQAGIDLVAIRAIIESEIAQMIQENQTEAGQGQPAPEPQAGVLQ